MGTLINTITHFKTELLLTFVFVIMLVWYLQHQSKRKKLYVLANQARGPPSYPIVGCAFHFLGSSEKLFKTILKANIDYGSPVGGWLGNVFVLSIWKPKQLEFILNNPDVLDKGQFYKLLKPSLGEGLITAPGTLWKPHRKLMMSAFSQKVLDGYVEVFSEKAEILVKLLEKEVGQHTFDMFDYISRCLLDTLCETVMGVTLDIQTKKSQYLEWNKRFEEIVRARITRLWLYNDFIFNLSSLSKDLYNNVGKMKEFTRRIVKVQRDIHREKLEVQNSIDWNDEIPNKKKALLELLIECSDFNDEELATEVNTFISAGGDTTSKTLSFMCLVLGMRQDVQQKVYEEILDVIGPDRPVYCEDLARLSYTERVIKETLRLFPPAPALARTTTNDVQMDKYVIPAGTTIGYVLPSLHRDPEYWPDPLVFNPDRFLPEETAKRHRYCFLPFSGGSRNCIGKRYAYMQMKTLMATIVRRYRMFSEYKSIEDIPLKIEILLRCSHGYKIRLESRSCP